MTAPDLLAWAEQQDKSGAFCVNPTVTTSGLPIENWFAGFLEVIDPTYIFRITMTSANTGITYTNTTYDGEWIGWKQLSIAASPQEYDLPLAEGVTSYGVSKYCKTQENVVIVNFAVAFSEVKTGSGSYLFATLPVGFQPDGVIVTSANAWCESPAVRNAVECDVRQGGGIYISTTEQSIQYVHGQVVFVAG